MSDQTSLQVAHDRRAFLGYFSTIGLGSTLLPGVLWSKLASGAEIDVATIASAEEVAGVKFSEGQRKQMVDSLKAQATQIAQLHEIPLDNAVAPALVFDPVPPGLTVKLPVKHATVRGKVAPRAVPANLEELAFLPVTELSELVRRRKVTSTQLTEMYLGAHRALRPGAEGRHHRDGGSCARAGEGGRRGDRARRVSRPLHGIPWGAKDLLAVSGYRTTWGAGPYRDQVIDADATVVKRLDAAGAVLIAKLTLGELAQGDIWFGGTTKNPWNARAGIERLLGRTGLGDVGGARRILDRHGDARLHLVAVHAQRCDRIATDVRPRAAHRRDGTLVEHGQVGRSADRWRTARSCSRPSTARTAQDRAVKDVPFSWDATLKPQSLRVGYVKSAFDLAENDDKDSSSTAPRSSTTRALDVFTKLGVKLIPVELPALNYGAMRIILRAEARRGVRRADALGEGQGARAADAERLGEHLPHRALHPRRGLREREPPARTIAMQKWHALFETVDVIVVPTTARRSSSRPTSPAIRPSSSPAASATPRTPTRRRYPSRSPCSAVSIRKRGCSPWPGRGRRRRTFHLQHPIVKV